MNITNVGPMLCRGLTLALTLLLGLASPGLTHASNESAVIEMTCVPPPAGDMEPGIGSPPPCQLPSGLDPRFVSSDPSGLARLRVMPDGSTRVRITLRGIAPDLVITAWLAYYFPPGPVPDHPVFQPIGEGLPAPAGVSVPLAPTYAGFTEGLGRDPNRFFVRRDKGWLMTKLDYNPFRPNQGPLRNELAPTQQAAAPTDSGASQANCCPDGFPVPRPQPIGASFLRQFQGDRPASPGRVGTARART